MMVINLCFWDHLLVAFSGREEGSRKNQLAVVQSDEEFALLGRDLLPKHGVNNITAEHLPSVKGYKAHVKLIPETQPMLCKARKIPLPLHNKVTEKQEQMVRQGILEPVQPGGVTNASPLVWQRKKSGELRLCAELKVHINGKVMDEDYPIPDMETIFHNLHGASYFGKIDLSGIYYQIELYKEAKDICTINTSQGQDLPTTSGIEKLFFHVPELHRINTQRNQRCCDLSRRCIGKWNYQGAFRQENVEHFVKSRQREKNFPINEKKSNSKPVDSVSFLGYSISKERIAQDPKHVEKNAKAATYNKQLESFVGLAKFYLRMIPDFATKMLTLNNMRNSDFSWVKRQQKAFEDIKNELCANLLVQPYSLQKEATVTTDASEKTIGGVFSREGHPVIYVSKN